MNQNSTDESNDFGDADEIRLLAPRWLRILRDAADALLQVEASMVRQGQQGTPCTQIHAAAGHALRAMEPVLALAATRTGGDQL